MISESLSSHYSLVLVGSRGGTHIAGSFERAARSLGWSAELVDSEAAMQAPQWVRHVCWRLLNRRPPRLGQFGQLVLDTCIKHRPAALLTTGLAPVTHDVLKCIRKSGIHTVNYQTDDPWNPMHRSNWFFKALEQYDYIFTPRRATVADLSGATAARVEYLPFAYDDSLFFREGADHQPADDIVFAGGADPDRVPWIRALADAGLQVALYGGYWERYSETRALARGHLDVPALRNAISNSKLSLCLVRRANRDGHCMRTFELAAMGSCMLVEWTVEHEEIFGRDGGAVFYFRSVSELVERSRWLLQHEDERLKLAAKVRHLIGAGGNTYRDRLSTILGRCAGASRAEPQVCER